jgi:AcrR family transcriptional regulator
VGGARRASYGPSSPVVGERGARTRQQLLDAALEQFAAHGFHDTVVDDIARAAGVSRATLYQYFDSREQIVTELLEECGAALMRVVRRVGPLSATAAGFDNLHWWLGEWSYVYDKYATMFVEWAHIDSPQTPLRPLIRRFVEGYTAQLAARIEQSKVEGLDPEQVSIALVTVIERFNYYRHTQQTGLSDAEMLDTLAVSVQLLLFPDTPWDQLVMSHPAAAGSAPRVHTRPRRELPATAPAPGASALAELSSSSRASVEQLLAAGARVFATNGYSGSSVDQILTEAGLSRRTFYKYFTNRLDLLVTLSDRCADVVRELAERFAAVGTVPHRAQFLRDWMAAFVAFHDEQGAVLRSWIEEPVDARVQRAGERGAGQLLGAFQRVLAAAPGPPGTNPRAAAWVLLALVERFPHQAVGTRYEVRGEPLVEVMAAFVERGLLAPEPPPS